MSDFDKINNKIKKLPNFETYVHCHGFGFYKRVRRIRELTFVLSRFCLYFTSGIFTVYHEKALDNYFIVCPDTYTVGRFTVENNMIVWIRGYRQICHDFSSLLLVVTSTPNLICSHRCYFSWLTWMLSLVLIWWYNEDSGKKLLKPPSSRYDYVTFMRLIVFFVLFLSPLHDVTTTSCVVLRDVTYLFVFVVFISWRYVIVTVCYVVLCHVFPCNFIAV